VKEGGANLSWEPISAGKKEDTSIRSVSVEGEKEEGREIQTFVLNKEGY